MDESVDVELAIFIRGINSEFIITEGLVELVPLKGNTIGKHVLVGFLECASKIQPDLKKLVSVTKIGWLKDWICIPFGKTCQRNKLGNKRDIVLFTKRPYAQNRLDLLML